MIGPERLLEGFFIIHGLPALDENLQTLLFILTNLQHHSYF